MTPTASPIPGSRRCRPPASACRGADRGDNLERRHTEDELGETIYSQFPVHSRSAITTAHTFLDRGIVSQDELRAKMEQIRARLERT